MKSQQPDPSLKLELVDNSMSHLRGQIVGPAGSPYEGWLLICNNLKQF